MKRYFSLYKQLNKINLSLFLAYRLNMFNEFVATSVWTALIISTMLIITQKATKVAGWTQGEMLLLSAGIIIVLGIFEIHFKRSFFQLADTIYYGELDSVLLRPVDSQFLVSFSSYKIAGLWRLVIGIVFLLFVVQKFHISYTLIDSIFFAIFLCVSSLLYYSLWLLVATILIWNPRLSNILEVMNSLNHASRFPPDMYKEFHTLLFLVLLPYMVLIATPVKVFLGKIHFEELMLFLFVTLLFFIVSRVVWKHALKYYTSVG